MRPLAGVLGALFTACVVSWLLDRVWGDAK